jgi:hypothetical protein
MDRIPLAEQGLALVPDIKRLPAWSLLASIPGSVYNCPMIKSRIFMDMLMGDGFGARPA